jgi:hypothetical protein
MLEGVDTIDWAALRACGGPATDIPGLLRAVLSEDEGVRLEAQFELFCRLWHQGTVSPAAAAAVPFLFELLTRPDTPDKGYFVELIAAIATGEGSLKCAVRTDGEAMWRRILAKQGESLDEVLAEAEATERAIHAAVSAGLRHLVPYLTDVVHQLPVAQALGNFVEHASWLVPTIDAALPSVADAQVRQVLAEARTRLAGSGRVDGGTP